MFDWSSVFPVTVMAFSRRKAPSSLIDSMVSSISRKPWHMCFPVYIFMSACSLKDADVAPCTPM